MNKSALLAAVLAAIVCLPAHAAKWLTDLPVAQAQAKAENKTILINFTGSDWCGWCIRLRQEVFSQPEFDRFASEKLVLVEVDFPRQKPLPASVQQINKTLARQQGVTGYPTVIIMNSQGVKVATMGYEAGGANNYIGLLKKYTGPAQASQSPPAAAPAPDKPPLPLFGGAPPVPAPTYPEPTLKGISGVKNKRLAMINDQTFGVGEAGIIKCGDKRVKIRCVEIRDATVLITIGDNGESKELRMPKGF